MNDFVKNIEYQVAINRLEQAIETLLNSLSAYHPADGQAKNEARELRNYIIGISQRLHDANDHVQKGLSGEEELQRERRTVSNNILNLIHDLDKYPDYQNYIKTLVEENAWKEATRQNTIAAYQSYFEKYPDGKYREETYRIMTDLREVERRREEEIKRLAEEERRRREYVSSNPSTQQGAYGMGGSGNFQNAPSFQQNTSASTKNTEVTFNQAYLILSYIGAVVLPIIGIGIGIYLRVAKQNGFSMYDAKSKDQGLYLIIVGVVMALINWVILNSSY
jgi:flagellar biosynthesis chaperone FliJ